MVGDLAQMRLSACSSQLALFMSTTQTGTNISTTMILVEMFPQIYSHDESRYYL